MDNYLFSGLKVLDVATVIAAPAAAMMLADFGAEVIKIERPGVGDMLRSLSNMPDTPDASNNWFWQMDGRNKRSLTLDLKSADGMEILRRLVEDCDVYITNQPYSVRNALGLTYEHLGPLNPSMIYASLTAYGEKGPERERKGFDQLAYWARSGLMDLMRTPDGAPTQGLPGMGDHPTAVSIYAGIVTALLHRERTGKGGMVHTSLLANGLWSVSGVAQGVLAGGDMTKYRERTRIKPAMMRVYQAEDGRWLQFNMVRNEELLSLLLTGMNALHLLTDERFADSQLLWENRGAFGDELQNVVGQKTSDEWLAIFTELDVPVNRVAIVEETNNDVQILENRMASAPERDDVTIPLVINHPIQISSVPQVGPIRAPDLGEHAEDILKELGYDQEAIADMKDRSVI
ncbi:MAG: CoA transferase [Acidimicrobiales bacterium]|nr:CoA transferase [Acidimicrobiales bacterium]